MSTEPHKIAPDGLREASASSAGPSKRRSRRLLGVFFRLAVVLAVLAAAELISHVLLRIMSASGPPQGEIQETHAAERSEDPRAEESALPQNVFSIHPYLGYVLDPSAKQSTSYPISDYGFNDEKSPIHERSAGKVIIGVFGGSVARHFGFQGGTAALEKTLRRSKRFAGKELVFVTLGMGGYKQPQQLMALNFVLSLGGEFDIVVNLDGFNEVALYGSRSKGPGVHPMWPINWQLLGFEEVSDPERLILIGEIAYSRERQASAARTLAARPWRYSAILKLAGRARNRVLGKRISDLQLALLESDDEDLSYTATGPKTTFDDASESFDKLVEIWRLGSIQMHHISAAFGIQYFHFLQPNQYVAGSKRIGKTERRRAISQASPYRESAIEGYPLLRASGKQLRAAGVNFHDLTMIYSEIDEPIYTDTCCHVNGLGNRMIGVAIAEVILQEWEEP